MQDTIPDKGSSFAWRMVKIPHRGVPKIILPDNSLATLVDPRYKLPPPFTKKGTVKSIQIKYSPASLLSRSTQSIPIN